MCKDICTNNMCNCKVTDVSKGSGSLEFGSFF